MKLNFVSASILCASLTACRTTDGGFASKLSENGETAVTGATNTPTPFHAFQCEAGDYAVFSFATPPDAPAAVIGDFGLMASNTQVISMPRKGSVLAAGDKYNVQLDICLVGDVVVPKRLTYVLPNLQSVGPIATILGVDTRTFVFSPNATAVSIENNPWSHMVIPSSSLQATGLESALFGDPSTLALEFDTDGEVFVMRSVEHQGQWTSGFYLEKTPRGSGIQMTPYLLTGLLDPGTRFGNLLDCQVGFEAEVDIFTIGTARYEAKGCHRYSHTSGSSHDYTYHHFTFVDPNPALPEAERQAATWEKDELAAHVQLDVVHHNWSDSLVIRLPSATYACYLGKIGPATDGSFPSDIPADQIAPRTSDDDSCIVKYGDQPWTPVVRKFVQ